MASITAVYAAHATLGAGVVDTVTLSAKSGGIGNVSSVEVQNEAAVSSAATSNIYFTVNGATPTVAGNDTYVALPGQAVRVPFNKGEVTKLIATGTPPYSVTAVLG